MHPPATSERRSPAPSISMPYERAKGLGERHREYRYPPAPAVWPDSTGDADIDGQSSGSISKLEKGGIDRMVTEGFPELPVRHGDLLQSVSHRRQRSNKAAIVASGQFGSCQ